MWMPETWNVIDIIYPHETYQYINVLYKKSPHWKWIPIFFKTQWWHSKMLGVAGPQVFSIQTIFNSTSPRGDSWKPCHLTPSPSESVRPMRALFATWFRTLMLVRVPTSIRDTWKTSLKNYHWLENDPPPTDLHDDWRDKTKVDKDWRFWLLCL